MFCFLSAKTAYIYYGTILGFVPTPIQISGTGSMYPTFPKGTGSSLEELSNQIVATPSMYVYPRGVVLLKKRFFRQELQHGDIISFANQKTQEIISKESISSTNHGFVKRVIGLPGDLIEIRDGYISLNSQRLEEPYIAEPRSTFGGPSVPDCTPTVVPQGSIFVLGDNRKASNDSRYDLGFVAITDITHVLSMKDQTQYAKQWRDTAHDSDLASTPLLNTKEYIVQLNKIRFEHKKPLLKNQEKLAESARLRATAMLKYNDLSFEATRSGLTMKQAMNKVGYSNIIWGEAPTLGYYTAEELLNNYSQFPSWEKFLLDEQYQDTGVASVVGEINGCPVQIVVQHVAGYVPPNYTPEEILSWKSLKTNQEETLNSWKRAREYGSLYETSKEEYEQMISLTEERISIAIRILDKLETKKWLTEEDETLIEKNKQIAEQQGNLAKLLNDRVKSANE